MRYIDNGTGDPREDALFPWLQAVLTGDVVGFRWQSGYFEASVLGLFMPVLQRLADEELDTIILIGSNDGETQSSAVHHLVDILGLPRPNALLGVVIYANGFYHPKTIHLCYRSGREVAYVGSSNMTSRGINGLNVEAGIVVDTDEGDSVDVLSHVKQVAGEWFVTRPDGLFEVGSHDDVDRLEGRGILTTERVVRRPRVGGDGPGRGPFPRRGLHHPLPAMPDLDRGEEDDIEDVPLEEPVVERAGPGREEPILDGPVLIAELTGPGRWGQTAFPQWFINNFFHVLPETGDVLHLWPVTQAGGVGAAEQAVCGFKAGSKNWYYELGLAAAIGAYPPPPSKPIGVFHRIDHQTCRYAILMPDDESYPHVARCLATNRDRLNRRANELPRTIVPAEVLRDAWPGSWFFEV